MRKNKKRGQWEKKSKTQKTMKPKKPKGQYPITKLL
jgi:hypothetical protein